MKSIEDHIEYDKKIIEDPQANPAARRHAKEELHELEAVVGVSNKIDDPAVG